MTHCAIITLTISSLPGDQDEAWAMASRTLYELAKGRARDKRLQRDIAGKVLLVSHTVD